MVLRDTVTPFDKIQMLSFKTTHIPQYSREQILSVEVDIYSFQLFQLQLVCCCLVTSVMSDSVWPCGLQPSSLPCPWQEYWSGLPWPHPGDLPDSGIELGSSALQAVSWPLSHQGGPTACLKVKVKVKSLSCVRLFVTPWTVAYQTLQSMGFSRQEYWSDLPFPSHSQIFHHNSLFLYWIVYIWYNNAFISKNA